MSSKFFKNQYMAIYGHPCCYNSWPTGINLEFSGEMHRANRICHFPLPILAGSASPSKSPSIPSSSLCGRLSCSQRNKQKQFVHVPDIFHITYMCNVAIASFVPYPLLNPNCSCPMKRFAFRTFNIILDACGIRLNVRCSAHSTAFDVFCSVTIVGLVKSSG